VGIAGAGAISQYHLAGWQQQPGVELAAICDPVAGRARARAEAFGIPRTYDDFAAMLAAERLDAVDIITPVATHAPLARMAADAGVHLCLQKPMCPTVVEGLRTGRAFAADRLDNLQTLELMEACYVAAGVQP
jgi:predicted dehydrogenase